VVVLHTSVGHLAEGLRLCVLQHSYRTFTRLMTAPAPVCVAMLGELDDTLLGVLPPGMVAPGVLGAGPGVPEPEEGLVSLRGLRAGEVVLALLLGTVVRRLVVEAHCGAVGNVAPAAVAPVSLGKVRSWLWLCLCLCRWCMWLWLCRWCMWMCVWGVAVYKRWPPLGCTHVGPWGCEGAGRGWARCVVSRRHTHPLCL
jgi:hypothetical protein